jgi:TetR/AcrR family transcriptional repressor of mexJK operon
VDAIQRRTAAKRQQIIDSARELFIENGFAGSSMDAVVAHAGVSKQTAYRYFPSKTDLLEAVLSSEIDISGIFAGPPPLPRTVEELRAALIGIARMVTTEMMQPRRLALIRLVLGEAFRIPELRDVIRDVLPGQFFERVQALLGLATAQGLIHSGRDEISARLYIGSIFSYVALDGFLRSEPLDPPPTADLEHLVDAFLRAVAVPTKSPVETAR